MAGTWMIDVTGLVVAVSFVSESAPPSHISTPSTQTVRYLLSAVTVSNI